MMKFTTDAPRKLVDQFEEMRDRKIFLTNDHRHWLKISSAVIAELEKVIPKEQFHKDIFSIEVDGVDASHINVYSARESPHNGDHYDRFNAFVALDGELLQVVCQNMVDLLVEREIRKQAERREQEARERERIEATATVLLRLWLVADEQV